jgi:hypothetical protein
MSRDELLTALKNARALMEAAVAGLTDAQLQEPGAADEWSVKDVLSHLTAWEAEVITIWAKFKRGQKLPKTLYTDAEIEAQNARWYAQNKTRPLDRVQADFQGVHKQLLRQVEAMTEREVNGPRPGGTSPGGTSPGGKATVAEWIRDWVVEHEEEHADHLAEWRKARSW